MKKLFLVILGIFIFTGCAPKVIIKKDNSISVNIQKQDANKEWGKLDKEK